MTFSNTRRFNDTDKRKLDLSDVVLEVDWGSDPPRLIKLRLDPSLRDLVYDQGVGPECPVFLDVGVSWGRARYNCGAVSDIGHDTIPTHQETGLSLLPDGVDMTAKFEVSVVSQDKRVLRRSPTIRYGGKLADLVVILMDRDLGSLPYRMVPPSSATGESKVHIHITEVCFHELKNSILKDGAMKMVFYIEAVRSVLNSFKEEQLRGTNPLDDPAFSPWITHFEEILGVSSPSSEEDEPEVIRTWAESVEAALGKDLDASRSVLRDPNLSSEEEV